MTKIGLDNLMKIFFFNPVVMRICNFYDFFAKIILFSEHASLSTLIYLSVLIKSTDLYNFKALMFNGVYFFHQG